MDLKKLRIATRQSPLALWQANAIRDQLLKHWPDLQIELLPMSTSGDQFLKDKLLTMGGKGLFVKELEEALLEKRADLAVHSMKDVPASFPDGLCLTAICTRDNPYDAFISPQYLTLDSLPQGARIGTSSLRRQSQLLAYRPDLTVQTLRGNIHTRIQRVQNQDFDGIILAMAGLLRMNLQSLARETLNDNLMLPACGQGALGIECRINDTLVRKYLAPLNDPLTALCVHTERHVNAQLGGTCHTPIAIYCQPITSSEIHLRARVLTSDGQRVLNHQEQGPQKDAQQLANKCAKALLDAGAKNFLTTT